MGLGDCPKIHDLALRADYKKACKTREYNYEFEVSFCCWHLIDLMNSIPGGFSLSLSLSTFFQVN